MEEDKHLHLTTRDLIQSNIQALDALREELKLWRETSIPLTAVRWMFLIVVLTVGGLRAVDKFLPAEATVVSKLLAENR